ncbi:MAG: GNAT family N-acetyltransferase [Actinobacteria bacterium]|nr:GNAT family N-acetyltransferase [Actinomycetota bacterium]
MTRPVEIQILKGVAEQDWAREIFDIVWPSDEGTQITSNLLQALTHNGSYVAGAFAGDEIVAAGFAFPGVDADGHLHLHSHMTAVKAEYRNRSIGSAIKWHQRDWALAHGYSRITWTFDPLVRRNAKLNLAKLGARAFEYFPDFYGELPDALNAGDPTDRAIALWDLNSGRVVEAYENRLAEIEPGDIPVALEVKDGLPFEKFVDAKVNTVLCYLPDDIIDLRAHDPALAMQWRLALRAQLQPRLDSGWLIDGFTTDGAYVLIDQEENGI